MTNNTQSCLIICSRYISSETDTIILVFKDEHIDQGLNKLNRNSALRFLAEGHYPGQFASEM